MHKYRLPSGCAALVLSLWSHSYYPFITISFLQAVQHLLSRVQFSSSIWDLLYDLNPSMPRRYPERPELAGCPCSPPSRRRIHRILLELPVERVQRLLIQTVCSAHSLARSHQSSSCQTISGGQVLRDGTHRFQQPNHHSCRTP